MRFFLVVPVLAQASPLVPQLAYPRDSSLRLTEFAFVLNDRGRIVSRGVLDSSVEPRSVSRRDGCELPRRRGESCLTGNERYTPSNTIQHHVILSEAKDLVD
jgi:hypothetical protein